MLTIKRSEDIPGAKNIKGHLSVQTSTGLSMKFRDAMRINQEGILLINQLIRRTWLSQRWEEHRERCREEKR